MIDDNDTATGDLFASSPMTRAGDHETSIAAAEAVKPVTGRIAQEVLAYALYRDQSGFTDDELKIRYPNAAESSHRKRRTELCEAGLIEPTDMTRPNRRGREERVWRITDKGRNA